MELRLVVDQRGSPEGTTSARERSDRVTNERSE